MPTSKHPLSDQDILFTRQRHDAKRAGLHWDYRFVLRDKAYSWSTKKEMPTPGKSIILFEQPVHTAEYALRKRIQIPLGEYGAGLTTLDFVRKAKAYGDGGDPDRLVVHVNGGDRFLLKKLGPAKYGKGSWLFKNLGAEETSEVKKVGIEKKSEMKENKYLIKIAEKAKKEIGWNDPVHTLGAHFLSQVGVGIPLSLGAARIQRSTSKTLLSPDPEIADRHTVKHFLRNNPETRARLQFDKQIGFPMMVTRDLGEINQADSQVLNGERTSGRKDFFKKDLVVHGGRGSGFVGGGFGVDPKKSLKFPGPATMHELGHAKDFTTHTKLKGYAAIMNDSPLAKRLLPGLLLANKKTEDYAVPAAVVPETLTLWQEGVANKHAYSAIKSHKGAVAANKFLTKYVPKQMAGYVGAAAIPIATTYAAKKLIEHFRNKNKKS